jgi:hypothetical protein
MKRLLVAAALLAASPALAQQQADPAFLNRALTALQAQRNAAMDQAAGEKARADGLADDLAKAQARIKELEKPPAKPAE